MFSAWTFRVERVGISKSLSTAPKPIAFCITDLDPGGAERALVQLVLRLDRSRWNPVVFCLSKPGTLVADLEQAGIPVECLGAGSIGNVSVLPRLVRRLRRVRPAILQTFLFHANIIGRIAGRLAGVPVIVSGIRVAEHRSGFRLWLDRITERMVTRHVCVSQAVADFSIERGGLSPEKIVVIPNGVDVERFQNAPLADLSQYEIPPGSRTLLFVGRLDPQKGPRLLLQAVRGLFPVHRNLHLLMVGDGPLATELKEWVCAQRLESRIHFAGWRPDVPSLLKAADVLVLPSRWEGMPNVVLEAMAAGRPVVATRVEGVSELVTDRETGLLVEPGSTETLAGGIALLLAEPDLGRSAGKKAQQVSKERFTIDAVASAYADLYVNLSDKLC